MLLGFCIADSLLLGSGGKTNSLFSLLIPNKLIYSNHLKSPCPTAHILLLVLVISNTISYMKDTSITLFPWPVIFWGFRRARPLTPFHLRFRRWPSGIYPLLSLWPICRGQGSWMHHWWGSWSHWPREFLICRCRICRRWSQWPASAGRRLAYCSFLIIKYS